MKKSTEFFIIFQTNSESESPSETESEVDEGAPKGPKGAVAKYLVRKAKTPEQVKVILGNEKKAEKHRKAKRAAKRKKDSEAAQRKKKETTAARKAKKDEKEIKVRKSYRTTYAVYRVGTTI